MYQTAILLLVALAGAVSAIAGASAEDYPTRLVKIVVPFPPGGPNDTLARTVGRRLGEAWGREIVVENKGGAGTQIGAEAVARAQPDGGTLMVTSESTSTLNPHLYRKLRYDGLADFTPIACLVTNHQALAAANSLPASTVAALVDLAKARPGTITYATFGLGSTGHLYMETLQRVAGIKLNVVHYTGTGPALNDLLGGHIQLFLTNASTVAPMAAEGRIRLLGLGAPQRSRYLSGLPTLAEGGIEGIDTRGWFGLFGPAGMPEALVARINADVQRVLDDPEFRSTFLAPNMFEPVRGSADDFAKLIREDWEKWRAITATLGLRLD